MGLVAIGVAVGGTRTVTDTTAVTALQAQVTGLQSELGAASQQVVQLQPALNAANQRLGQLQSQLTTANQRATALQSQLTTANQRVGQLQAQASAVEAQKRQNEALAAQLRRQQQQSVNHADKGLVAQQVSFATDAKGYIGGIARVFNTTPFLVTTHVTFTLLKGGQAVGTVQGVVGGAAPSQTMTVTLTSVDKMPAAYDAWTFQADLWQ